MRWILCASLLAGLSGCHAFYMGVDGRIAERAAKPIDVQPVSAEIIPLNDLPRILPPGRPEGSKKDARVAPRRDAELIQTAGEKAGPKSDKDKTPAKGMLERLQVPDEV